MLWTRVRPRSPVAGILVGGALLSSLVFLWSIVVPQLSGPGLHAHDGHLPNILAHFIGGSFMLVAGAVALRIGLTRRWMRWHKVAGYSYLVGGGIGAVSGIVASFGTPHAIGLSTATLGIVWLGSSGMALRAALNRRFDIHRAWMIRSYAVAWGAVLFRIWTHLLPASWQFPPTDMLWTSWVMPLFLAECGLQWRAGKSIAAPPRAGDLQSLQA